MNALTLFLAVVFLAASVAPSFVEAGGGGCEDCNDTMVGIAIGTTLILLGILLYQAQQDQVQERHQESRTDPQETSSVQFQSTDRNGGNPEWVIYRW